MATIISRQGDEYLFDFSPPETNWIREIAKSMGITKESVVGAAMNVGLTHYVESFCPKPEPPKKDIDDNACDDIC